jgi:hypothetical protein
MSDRGRKDKARRNGRTGNRLLGIEPKRTAPSQPISVKGTQVPVWVKRFAGGLSRSVKALTSAHHGCGGRAGCPWGRW